MSYKLAQLTVNPQQKSPVTSKVFVSQPSAEEELLVGRLFVLMEIDASRADDFTLADFIVRDIYQQYYQNEQFFLRDKISNLKIDYIFEAALTKLNRGVAEYIEQQKLRPVSGGLKMIIGVMHKNRLLFAQTGSNKALLFYRPKSKTGQLLDEYSLIDITEKTDDPTQEITSPNKLFSNVINGAIPANGFFFFSNEALLEYLSKKQLTEIITTLPPAGAAEHIKNLLEQTNAFVPFFGLIIKNTSGEERSYDPYAAVADMTPAQVYAGGGRTSVSQLNLTQEKTEQLLSASGLINIKKWIEKLKPASSGLKSYAHETASHLKVAGSRLNAKREKLQLGRKTIDIARIAFSLILDGLKAAFTFVTDGEARTAAIASFRNRSQNIIGSIISLGRRFVSLPLKHKILLSIAAATILILIGNVAYSGVVRQRQAAEAKVAETKALFSQKENQLEASLLYNNTEGSRQILDEMNALLAELPRKTEADKASYAELENRYHERLDRIYHITRLTNPAPYAELPAEADSLFASAGAVFAASGSSKTVYRVDSSKTVRESAFASFSGKPILSAGSDSGLVYFWDGESLISHDPASDSFSAPTIDNRPTAISAGYVYNSRFYTADAGAGQIYRFNRDRAANSFTGRIVWLRDQADLSGASAMAIDGRIYLLANNRILEFAGGRTENIAFDPISPALESPTKLFAAPEGARLYVLDPKNKRVVVFDPTGKYVAQYMSDSFTDLRDIAVDETAGRMFLLNGKTIYDTDVTK